MVQRTRDWMASLRSKGGNRGVSPLVPGFASRPNGGNRATAHVYNALTLLGTESADYRLSYSVCEGDALLQSPQNAGTH